MRRGKEHSYVLDAELQKFWDSKPCTVVHEYDAKHSRNLYRFKVHRAAPLNAWALIIGDAVHNARSALDYIAWRLAGGIIEDTRTLFPICRDVAEFEEAARRRLKRVHQEAVAAIGEIQPYLRPNLKESALWTLDELDRRDKHRLLTPTQYFVFPSSVVMHDALPCTVFVMPGSRIENDAVLAEVAGLENPDVKIELQLSFDILFERGILSATADYEVRHVLSNIFEAVDIVIAKFDWLLIKHPDWIKNP